MRPTWSEGREFAASLSVWSRTACKPFGSVTPASDSQRTTVASDTPRKRARCARDNPNFALSCRIALPVTVRRKILVSTETSNKKRVHFANSHSRDQLHRRRTRFLRAHKHRLGITAPAAFGLTSSLARFSSSPLVHSSTGQQWTSASSSRVAILAFGARRAEAVGSQVALQCVSRHSEDRRGAR